MPDVFEYKKVQPKKSIWPTQKPVELFIDLISQSTEKGEIVFDPFVGSGSTILAAKMLERNFIGSDKSKKAVEIAGDRIKAV